MNYTLGLITYDRPHLKTQQVLEQLLAKSFKTKLYTIPFVPRKPRKPKFQHRPKPFQGIPPEEIAKQHQLPLRACHSDTEIDNACDLYMVLGAGILSEECLEGKKVLNVHPGIIPISRGLDSFKWAIYHKRPLGNTLHYIDKEVDKGEVVSVLPTPVYPSDTPESLALRHYALEIGMLVDFERHLEEAHNPFEHLPSKPATRRMKPETEQEMLHRFKDYVEEQAYHSKALHAD
jgi:phosphoribosylglycinamide formyltransferase-1